jgi:hypothetical protein
MDTLGADGERHVQSVVDGQAGAVLVRDGQQLLRMREQGRGRGRLVAQLDPVEAAVQGQGDGADQLLRPAAGFGDEMELVVGPGRRQERFPPLV